MKTLKEKNNESTNNDSWIKKSKTTIKHPRERKKRRVQKWRKIIQNCCYLENFDFDIEEILDKSLSFDLKKTSEEKMFDSILEKIPDKNNVYYIEHREETNAFRIRKDSKQAAKKMN